MGEAWAVWWAAQTLPAIEWWACGLAFVYVALAARNSVWCWPFAFVSSLLWAHRVWFEYGLLFDAVLNLFYAAMAIIGLMRWLNLFRREGAFAKTSGESLAISRMESREHLRLIATGLALTGGLYVLAKAYTTAQLAGLDAITTVFSVLATFLLIDRRLENWLYFVVVDAVYVWIYLDRGSVVFALTFVIYTVMAVVGWRSWSSEARVEAAKL